MFDGITRYIELPEKKVENICASIKQALCHKGMKFKSFEKLVGKMRHESLGIPGSLGLFTPINQLFRKQQKWICLQNYHEVGDILSDLILLLRESTKDLIKATILVPSLLDYLGHYDAYKLGAGGEGLLMRVVFGTNCMKSIIGTQYPTTNGIV